MQSLTGAHLEYEHVRGRFTFHDQLRAYAAERAHASDPEPDRLAATRRMIEHYVHSAQAAEQLVHPERERLPLDPPAAGVVIESFTDSGQAMGWFIAERVVLVGAVRYAY